MCGRIKTGVELIKSDGTNIGSINEIQNRGESIATADEGMQVAISMKKPTFGRQIKENEILYVDVDIEEMNKLRGLLSPDEEKLLTEVYEIKTDRRRRDAGRD